MSRRASAKRDDAHHIKLFAPPVGSPLLETDSFQINGADYSIVVSEIASHPGAEWSVPSLGIHNPHHVHFVPVRR